MSMKWSVCPSAQMPKVQYRSNCKPSTFAYPPALEVPKEKEKEKVRRFFFFFFCINFSDGKVRHLSVFSNVIFLPVHFILALEHFSSLPHFTTRDAFEVINQHCASCGRLVLYIWCRSVFKRPWVFRVLSETVETSLLLLCMTGFHCCSLHHCQGQEEGEGKERKGGGEDGSG